MQHNLLPYTDLRALTAHAEKLADEHIPLPGYSITDLFRKLSDYRKTNNAVIKHQLTKTAELLKKVKGTLPRLQQGKTNLPRIFVISQIIVEHTAAQLEPEHIKVFLLHYQSVACLRTSELDAVQAMLKLALLEKLAFNTDHNRNCISSLQLLDTINWNQFNDDISIVEQLLCRDQVYAKMDYYTRYNYRCKIGDIACKADFTEQELARWIIRLSVENNVHIGYYLNGKNSQQLAASIGIKQPHNYKQLLYWTGITTVSLLVCILVQAPLWCLPLLLILAVEWGITITNGITSGILQPALLPRMDFSDGIPVSSTTLVAVPSMLVSKEQIRTLVEGLEIRYLACKSPHLYFALVTDHTDAATSTIPDDDVLLQCVKDEVNALNKKYSDRAFYLLHRSRTFNKKEGIWMGYERKRGKLMELNQLLRGSNNGAFTDIIGDVDLLQQVKYVITLDEDTQLPRDAAWKMIATMAHPLNTPVYSKDKRRIVAGYGMLQPQTAVHLSDMHRSRYVRLTSFAPNIDPYTRAISNVYQDLFGEGSFTGKGIYDVDVMLNILQDQLPENRILSHDLLEGCYVRAGLLNDLQLYEQQPTGYLADMQRRHRWVRGDWQIATWITGNNPLSFLSRWKIADNLRRSLLPLCAMVLLFKVNILFVIATIFLPALTALIISACDNIFSLRQWRNAFRDTSNCFIQCAYTLVCLPYEAYIMTDAIVRALYRLTIKHKLLEWTPSGTVNNQSYEIADVYRIMAIAPVAAVVYAFYSPLFLCWMAAPLITIWMNRSDNHNKKTFKEEDETFLRGIAYKTWLFFETFVTAEENWLPPDHYQEYPVKKVPTYTSPTNMGLVLLANLSALEMKFITLDEFIERTNGTLSSMGRMKRYKGHFYNWYSTRTLEPSLPGYISSVDSGNLAGHLLTLAQALRTMATDHPSPLLEEMAAKCYAFTEMEYDFLYNKELQLLSIGYHVEGGYCDTHHYDVLASEARLATFTAIAQGKLPVDSWFSLGRPQSYKNGRYMLLSANGTMFEYLMPLLIMPEYQKTLLYDTYRAAVEEQISFGELHHIPWGVSECCYNAQDPHQNYQYKASGIPSLSVKTGLQPDMVVTPYAAAMALMVKPKEACSNLRKLSATGAEGEYGFYEAVDYLPSRLQGQQQHAVVGSFMAHHQGMIFLSIANVLHDFHLQKLFAADPQVKTALVLLQENTTSGTICYEPEDKLTDYSNNVISTKTTTQEEVHLLSNGHYHLLVSASGLSSSRWNDIVLTDGLSFNVGYTGECYFSAGTVRFEDEHTSLTITVDPAHDREIRRLIIRNKNISLAPDTMIWELPAGHYRYASIHVSGVMADLVQGVADSYESAIEKAKQPVDEAVFFQAEQRGNLILSQIGAAAGELQQYRLWLKHLLFTHMPDSLLSAHHHAITGDEATAIIWITQSAGIPVIEQFIRAQAYWRIQGWPVKLLIWNRDQRHYKTFLQRRIMESITGGIGAEMFGRQQGGIFIISAAQDVPLFINADSGEIEKHSILFHVSKYAEAIMAHGIYNYSSGGFVSLTDDDHIHLYNREFKAIPTHTLEELIGHDLLIPSTVNESLIVEERLCNYEKLTMLVSDIPTSAMLDEMIRFVLHHQIKTLSLIITHEDIDTCKDSIAEALQEIGVSTMRCFSLVYDHNRMILQEHEDHLVINTRIYDVNPSLRKAEQVSVVYSNHRWLKELPFSGLMADIDKLSEIMDATIHDKCRQCRLLPSCGGYLSNATVHCPSVAADTVSVILKKHTGTEKKKFLQLGVNNSLVINSEISGQVEQFKKEHTDTAEWMLLNYLSKEYNKGFIHAKNGSFAQANTIFNNTDMQVAQLAAHTFCYNYLQAHSASTRSYLAFRQGETAKAIAITDAGILAGSSLQFYRSSGIMVLFIAQLMMNKAKVLLIAKQFDEWKRVTLDNIHFLLNDQVPYECKTLDPVLCSEVPDKLKYGMVLEIIGQILKQLIRDKNFVPGNEVLMSIVVAEERTQTDRQIHQWVQLNIAIENDDEAYLGLHAAAFMEETNEDNYIIPLLAYLRNKIKKKKYRYERC